MAARPVPGDTAAENSTSIRVPSALRGPMRQSFRHRWLPFMAGSALVLGLVGSAVAAPALGANPSAHSGPVPARAPAAAGIAWTRCSDDGAECGSLEVPLDYALPDG